MVKIRKTVLGLAALGAIAVSATAAFADGYRGGPRYAPPPFSWTGFYIGGNVGYAWANSEHCDRADCSGGAPTFPQADPRGGFGGLTAGYNYQVSRDIVIGIEGDYNFAHLKDTVPSTATFGCAGGCATVLGNFGTIRGRVGYAYGTSLAYFTAGVAFTEWKGRIGIPTLQSGSSTETGAVIGGGFEFAFAPRWSAKIEYLHIFDGDTFVYAPAFCASPGCQIKNEDVDLVRLGLNFRLN